jgi:hypothetical protein
LHLRSSHAFPFLAHHAPFFLVDLNSEPRTGLQVSR